MPKVPLLQQQTSLRPVATPYEDAPRNQGLQIVGESLQKFGGQASQASAFLYKQKEEADSFRADQADLDFGKELNTVLHDSRAGFLNQQGERALNDEPALSAVQKARDKIGQSLANDEQRRRFFLRADARAEQARVQMERHVADQRVSVYKNVAEGQGQLALETARLQYADPQAVSDAIEKVMVGPEGEPGPLRRALLAQGLPLEKVIAEENAFRAKGYASALEGYIEKLDGPGAKAYFEQVKDKLGPQAGKMQKAVDELFKSTEAERTAVDIITQATDKAYGWVDLQSASDAIESVPEGVMRDEVRKRVEHRMGEAKKLKEQAGDDKYQEALSIYYESGKNLHTPAMAPVRAWLLDPKNGAADQWKKLESEDWREKTQTRGERDKTDQQALWDFKARPRAEQERINIDSVYGGQASKQARDQMRQAQNEVREAVRKGESIADPDLRDRTEEAVQGVALLRTSKTRAAAFKARLNDWAMRYRKENKGNSPTLEELDAEISRALQIGDKTGGGMSTNKFRFESAADEPFVPFDADEQPYLPNKLGTAPQPTPMGRPQSKVYRRVVNGEPRVWNGTAWVKE